MKKSLLVTITIVLFGLAAAFILHERRGPTIIFVGDMFFDRHIREISDTKSQDFIFSCIDDFLQKADLAVGNLEGPITTYPSMSLGSKSETPENYVFTFPTTTAALLMRHNVGTVSLGNNHIGNFGREGIASTHNYLDEAGVGYFGGLSGDEPIYHTELGGVKIAFIAYNQFGGDTADMVAKKIADEKSAGNMVIVYAHWGEEYSPPTPFMRQTAAMFAKSGATAVIGSHPHVVLSSERIGQTTVYYSLGNFIFDQYWDDEVSTGLALEMRVRNGGLDIQEHKTIMNRDGRTCLVGD